MKKFTNKYTKVIVEILFILIGTFLHGMAFRVFLTPHKITPGGFSGLSFIIQQLLSYVGVNLSASIIYIILNIILFIFAFRFLGKRFIIFTALAVILYSVFMTYANFQINIGDDMILNAVYGGVLAGVGTGILLRIGYSTGGSEILVVIINKLFPQISSGMIQLFINSLVVICSVLVFGFSYSLYALITIFISSKFVDMVLDGTRSVRAVYIVTNQDKALSKQILYNLKRGVTKINAEGMFSNSHKYVLLCVISRSEVSDLRKIVKNTDKDAFMFSLKVAEATGELFDKRAPKITFKNLFSFKKLPTRIKKSDIEKVKKDEIVDVAGKEEINEPSAIIAENDIVTINNTENENNMVPIKRTRTKKVNKN